jgi:uncharacterized protein (DUF1778 family)
MARLNTAEPRTHRLEARIAPKALALIKRAAEAKGSSLSDFVVAAAREVAARELEEQNIIRLSAQEQRQYKAHQALTCHHRLRSNYWVRSTRGRRLRAAWHRSTNIFESESAKMFVDERPLATWLARSSLMRSPATTL